MKTLIVLVSYHHHNTEKVAKAICSVLDADLKTPKQVNLNSLAEYDLIGFGSGIYNGKHHESLLKFVEKISKCNKTAFIFSTSGTGTGNESQPNNHSALRNALVSKGLGIINEFNCPGYDTVFPFILRGGLSKGRPNDEDLKLAESFARNLKQTSKTTSK